eukprot:scaffold7078_cov56-Phaeocystis_antarctica.AAC.2
MTTEGLTETLRKTRKSRSKTARPSSPLCSRHSEAERRRASRQRCHAAGMQHPGRRRGPRAARCERRRGRHLCWEASAALSRGEVSVCHQRRLRDRLAHALGLKRARGSGRAPTSRCTDPCRNGVAPGKSW